MATKKAVITQAVVSPSASTGKLIKGSGNPRADHNVNRVKMVIGKSPEEAQVIYTSLGYKEPGHLKYDLAKKFLKLS